MYQKALMERQQDTHVSSACKIKAQELMKKILKCFADKRHLLVSNAIFIPAILA